MSWQTLIVAAPNDALKEAIVGEFSADRLAGVWERPDGRGGVELVIYFDALPPLLAARLGRTFERNGYPAPAVTITTEDRMDWTETWRKGFTSFDIGRRFRVVPSWESEPEPPGRIVLRIDPGLAFGTGTHETTQMVLEAMEPRWPAPGRLLDVGAGSGILAIAAVKLGGGAVTACDIDADAVAVARENFRRNACLVDLFTGSIDAVRSDSVGAVLANLTFDVIDPLLPEFVRVLQPGGRAILSGILDVQADALERRLGAGPFTIEHRGARGEWVALVVRKHGG